MVLSGTLGWGCSCDRETPGARFVGPPIIKAIRSLHCISSSRSRFDNDFFFSVFIVSTFAVVTWHYVWWMETDFTGSG
jgi:hypothetical protein